MAATALFYATYFLLVFARMFLVAFQHFYWFLLVSIAPFLILGTLFEATTALTKALFKNLLQVAAWPIVWSVLSAFVKALPFSLVYGAENEDIVAIAGMNLIFEGPCDIGLKKYKAYFDRSICLNFAPFRP